MSGLDYRSAGVDIDAGAALVDAISPLARSTERHGCVSGLGGFGALFDLKRAGFHDPILVAGTDGVGTKLKVALAVGVLDTIGIDLVAMCVNDVVVQGAEPLFFLDYYATGKLSVEVGRTIIGGIAEGCRQAGCALIGGETAEMPGLYAGDDFDLAGFCVGAAERGRILNGEAVREGDVVLGLASSGAHANGFSLIRKLVAALALDYHAPAPFDPSRPLGLALLTPTRIYVKSCLAALAAGGVGAFAHITGGGLTENLPRVLPPSLAVALDAGRWPLPPLFGWLAAAGGLSSAELARTFNCGIGMAVIAAADRADGVGAVLQQAGEQVAVIGKVVRRQADRPAVVLSGTERAWKS